MSEAAKEGGIVSKLKKVWLGANAAAVFARLFLLRPIENALPASSHLSPAW